MQYLVGNRHVSSTLESKVVVGIPLTRDDEGRGRSPPANLLQKLSLDGRDSDPQPKLVERPVMESMLVLEKWTDRPLRRASVNAGVDGAGKVPIAFPAPVSAILGRNTGPRQSAGRQCSEHNRVVLPAIIRLPAEEAGTNGYPEGT